MKKLNLLGLLVAAVITLSLISMVTGCKTTTTTNPDGSTNVVHGVDPVRIKQAQAAIEPAVSSVLRRAIKNSPTHAQEIGDYSRAIGSVFCQMAAKNNFSVDYLVVAVDAATLKYQAVMNENILDAKNALVALYKIFAADQLTWQLPDNQWLKSICELFCNSIDTALKDAGQVGIK